MNYKNKKEDYANAYQRGLQGIADSLDKRLLPAERVSMAQECLEWAFKLSVYGWRYNYNASHGMLSTSCFAHIMYDTLYNCTATNSCPSPEVFNNALTILFHNRKRLYARDDCSIKKVYNPIYNKWSGDTLTIMGSNTYHINCKLDKGKESYDLINLYKYNIYDFDWLSICPDPHNIEYCLREMLSEETYGLMVYDILPIYYKQYNESQSMAAQMPLAMPSYDCDVEDIYEEYKDKNCFIFEEEETIRIMEDIRQNALLVFNRIYAKRHERYCAHFLRALIYPKKKKRQWLTGYNFPMEAIVRLIGMNIIKEKSLENVLAEYRKERMHTA